MKTDRLVFCFCFLLLRVSDRQAHGWSVEPIDLSGNGGWSLFIDVDSSNTPHVAYFVSGSSDYGYAERETYGWQQRAGLPGAQNLALDHNDQPFFVARKSPDFNPYLGLAD